MALGLEFQPQAEEGTRQHLNTSSPAAQEALQILSLRLPRLLGGAPLSPEDLLGAGGMPGRGPTSLIDLIRSVLGGSGQAPVPPVGGAPFAPQGPTPQSPISTPTTGQGLPTRLPTPSLKPGDRPFEQQPPSEPEVRGPQGPTFEPGVGGGLRPGGASGARRRFQYTEDF